MIDWNVKNAKLVILTHSFWICSALSGKNRIMYLATVYDHGLDANAGAIPSNPIRNVCMIKHFFRPNLNRQKNVFPTISQLISAPNTILRVGKYWGNESSDHHSWHLETGYGIGYPTLGAHEIPLNNHFELSSNWETKILLINEFLNKTHEATYLLHNWNKLKILTIMCAIQSIGASISRVFFNIAVRA